jgi:hypothetical protein
MKIILDFYKEMKNNHILEIKKQLENRNKYSLTLDEWTSCGNKRYFNINIHVNDNQFINLGLVRIKGKCDSYETKKIVEKHVKTFGLDLKRDIVGSTSDGAAVMIKFGRECPFEMQLCYNHALHLAVVDIIYKIEKKNTPSLEKSTDDEAVDSSFEENDETDDNCVDVDDINNCDGDVSFRFETNRFTESNNVDVQTEFKHCFAQVRKIVRLFRSSPVKNSALQIYVKKEHGKEYQLIIDVKTRWNSLLSMIERVLFLKEAVEKCLNELNSRELHFESHIELLEHILVV